MEAYNFIEHDFFSFMWMKQMNAVLLHWSLLHMSCNIDRNACNIQHAIIPHFFYTLYNLHIHNFHAESPPHPQDDLLSTPFFTLTPITSPHSPSPPYPIP